jgi:hypothetical protein
MRRLWGRRGQIVIPALFVFPSLMLFIYLIYETAKLSREKIRHQFAIDAAAFVEMTNYSDFLNRTAYVNGAFPMRIFNEGFDDDYTIDCDKKVTDCGSKGSGKKMRDLLYENGVFPTSKKHATGSGLDDEKTWDIAYDGTKFSSKNDPTPNLDHGLPNAAGGEPALDILTWQNAHDWWINWDEAQSIFRLYVNIYQLLGSVEQAQLEVLKRLSAGHNFLAKSYWLNTGENVGAAAEAVSSFDRNSTAFMSKTKAYCYAKIGFYGNHPTDPNFQGWEEYTVDTPDKRLEVPYSEMCSNTGGKKGLFQMMAVDPGEIQRMRRGYDVIQHWKAPGNFFNVDFNTGIKALNGGQPFVQARVTCGEASGAAVWPSPTPKFQVRLYP